MVAMVDHQTIKFNSPPDFLANFYMGMQNGSKLDIILMVGTVLINAFELEGYASSIVSYMFV